MQRQDRPEPLWDVEELEGLRRVLCGEAARKLMRRELRALLPDPDWLGSCRLRRAKFKPGKKLTANYDVQVRDRYTGVDTIRPIKVTWTPGANQQSLSDTQDRLLDAGNEAACHEVAGPFRRLIVDRPASGMYIQIWPLDGCFPQLARLADAQLVSGIINRTFASKGAQYAITPVRYRPDERHVLRYDTHDVAGSHGPGTTIFAKPYKCDDAARAFGLANGFADLLAGGGGEMIALPPLRYAQDMSVIFYPHADGIPLSQRIRCRRSSVEVDLWRVGSALRTVHCPPESFTGEIRCQNFASELKRITRAAAHVHLLLPTASSRIREILRQAEELHNGLPKESPTIVHGDFKTDHVWVTRRGVTLIDFDSCCVSEPATDVGKFLADLQWLYAAHNLPGMKKAQKCFLDGYAIESRDRLVRARLYEAVMLLKMTVRRIPLFLPDWALRTERLIGQSEAVVRAIHALIRS